MLLNANDLKDFIDSTNEIIDDFSASTTCDEAMNALGHLDHAKMVSMLKAHHMASPIELGLDTVADYDYDIDIEKYQAVLWLSLDSAPEYYAKIWIDNWAVWKRLNGLTNTRAGHPALLIINIGKG